MPACCRRPPGPVFSSISNAVTNTGTLTATSGTLELDSGGALGGTIGATGAGTLALNGGTFTVGGATQDHHRCSGVGECGRQHRDRQGYDLGRHDEPEQLVHRRSGHKLATTGTTSISGQSFLDSKLVWNNSGTVSAGGNGVHRLSARRRRHFDNRQPVDGVFDLTVDGGAFTSTAKSTLALSNAGVLSKTAGTGISSVLGVMTNTGTITATSGTLELDGGGTLGGTVTETTTGAVTLGAGRVRLHRHDQRRRHL